MRDMSRKQFEAALKRHGMLLTSSGLPTVWIRAKRKFWDKDDQLLSGATGIDLLRFYDGKKVHYRAALAYMIREQERIQAEYESKYELEETK